MTEIVSEEYIQAVALNRSIIANAQAAQMSLYEVCKGLKEMRDGKLYKELGYHNFEEYCETEVGLKRRQAYSYISIAENLPDNFVQSTAQKLGTQKLYLLSTLSEDDRQELTERVEVEDISTRQLKAEIDKLKAENSQLEGKCFEIRRNCDRAEQRAVQLAKEVEELESRPLEVIASPVNDEVEKMRQAMLQNSKEWGEKYDQLQEENEKAERALHQKYQTALSQQKAQYEQKLSEVENSTYEDAAIMQVYVKNVRECIHTATRNIISGGFPLHQLRMALEDEMKTIQNLIQEESEK